MNDTTPDHWLDTILTSIPKARVSVFGDFALDAYWDILEDGELSVETLRPIRKVREQRYSLGGASNVIANVKSLGAGKVRAVGLLGKDQFGWLMRKMLEDIGVDTAGMLDCQDDWQTNVYGKPHMEDIEQQRIDFGAFNELAGPTVDALADALEQAVADSDVVILNQQVPKGVTTSAMIERINDIIKKYPACRFIVDSRDRPDEFGGCMLKFNAHEALAMLGEVRSLDQDVPVSETPDLARRVFEKTGKPVFVTRGGNGIVVADEQGTHEVHGIQILEQTDTVGAGDTVIATLATAMAAGADNTQAAQLANMAASITCRKLRQCGTASPAELRDLGEPDYIYNPDLAEDTRHANYLDGSEIEIIRELPEGRNIKHAIFDHDGTISVLREGWEEIMEPVMVKAILGPRYDDIDDATYKQVVQTSREFIDKTTGIQTLVQMQGLIKLVEQFGFVPEDEILDMHGYKAIYNEALLDMVNQRIAKLERGELDSTDYQLKGALDFLKELHRRGVRMYLASGTDETDVIAEAKALGYADLFEGGIFGAVGDITKEAKRDVLERIIREGNLHGSELATFGDGPVEMRETRKQGGITVGIASDEVRRFGMNKTKRTRLIKAGCDILIPDFSQQDRLVKLLFNE